MTKYNFFLKSMRSWRLPFTRGKLSLKLLIVSVVPFGCGQDETFSYPSSYYKTNLEQFGNVRVFVTQGEITSKALVDRYSEMDSYYFDYMDQNLLDYNEMDSVRFYGPVSGAVSNSSSWLECDVNRQIGLEVFTQNEAINWCCYYGEVYTRQLEYHMGKIKAEVNSEYVYSSTLGGYLFGYIGRNKFVFIRSGNSLTAPIISYHLHSVNRWGSWYINNVLQADFFKSLPPGDTLVLRESRLIYEKSIQ